MRYELTKIIDKSMEYLTDAPRNYIGASGIGGDCLRKIWYSFKGENGESLSPRVKRILDVGKNLEEAVDNWLRDAGVIICRLNPELVDDEMSYFKGNVDGIWVKGLRDSSPIAIIEIKTANDSRFKLLVKDGVKKWSKEYYAQIQAYMGLSGIHSAYILVLNKDNSDLYDEKVIFDPDFYQSLRQKAKMIYDAKTPPPRVHGSPLWWQCKLCKYNEVCHK